MLIEKSVESRASTVTDELMLKYVPECFNMRQYDSLAHGFRKAFRLLLIASHRGNLLSMPCYYINIIPSGCMTPCDLIRSVRTI